MRPLIPNFSHILPSAKVKLIHEERNAAYTADKFQNYNDWFYFIHIDPVLRWWHSFGCIIGSFFFVRLGFSLYYGGLSWEAGRYYLLGVFFFYVLPLISHLVYDGGSAKSTPDKFHSTLLPVIHINYLTVTGQYDKWLRKFKDKYPFTDEAWKLEERNYADLFRKAPHV